jgi:UDP-glucose 4-epimerase
MSQPTLLITGGAGFIGSYVNKFVQQAGYRTLVLDNLSRSSQHTFHRGQFIKGDVGDAQLLDQLFSQTSIDAVMHFASWIDVGESVRNPAAYYLNNVTHTHTLLQAMLRHNIKNFIFSSTAAIFGSPHYTLIDEEHPCEPINPYGRSKWMVEQILQDFDQAYGLKSCCLRYFNAAGGDPEGKLAYAPRHLTNLIPIVLRSIQTRQPLTVFGTDYDTFDGTCVRDYIHIHDLAQAHLLGLEQLWQTHQSTAYNLGNGKGYSVKEVIHAAEKVTGYLVDYMEGPRRAGDPAILVANAKKALKELRWVPVYGCLDKIIEDAWRVLHVS